MCIPRERHLMPSDYLVYACFSERGTGKSGGVFEIEEKSYSVKFRRKQRICAKKKGWATVLLPWIYKEIFRRVGKRKKYGIMLIRDKGG